MSQTSSGDGARSSCTPTRLFPLSSCAATPPSLSPSAVVASFNDEFLLGEAPLLPTPHHAITTTHFILRNVSHKGSEADVIFARHGYSGPAQGGQATGKPPWLIINHGGQC